MAPRNEPDRGVLKNSFHNILPSNIFITILIVSLSLRLPVYLHKIHIVVKKLFSLEFFTILRANRKQNSVTNEQFI